MEVSFRPRGGGGSPGFFGRLLVDSERVAAGLWRAGRHGALSRASSVVFARLPVAEAWKVLFVLLRVHAG